MRRGLVGMWDGCGGWRPDLNRRGGEGLSHRGREAVGEGLGLGGSWRKGLQAGVGLRVLV